VLAERLGMTVTELCARMPHAELLGWAAHDELTAFELEHARKQAEMNARAGG
jgi:hypothetical protein